VSYAGGLPGLVDTGISIKRLTRTAASFSHRNAAGVYAVAAVASQETGNRNFCADRQGVAAPAVALQAVGRAKFGTPVHYFAGGRIFHVQVDPHVRVGPLDLGNDAGQILRLVA